MKTRYLEVFLALGLTLLLGACSSSKPKEGEMTDIIPASTEAGTDIVPAPTAEGTPAATPEAPNTSTQAPADASQAQAAAAPAPDSQAAPEAGPVKKKKKKHNAQQQMAAAPVDLGPMAAGEYSVQRGDTLMKIAFETYGDIYKWKSIYDANRDKIQDPSRIPAGTVLKVEKPVQPVAIERNGEKYQIQTGDTLGKISKNVYGTPGKWKTIWNNNKQLIHDPNKIFAGFSLYYVPEAGAPAPMASGQMPQGGQAPNNAFANSNAPNQVVGGSPAGMNAGGPAPASIAQPAPDPAASALPSN